MEDTPRIQTQFLEAIKELFDDSTIDRKSTRTVHNLGIVLVGIAFTFNLFTLLILLLSLLGDYGLAVFAIITSIVVLRGNYIICSKTGANKPNRGDDEFTDE